MPEVSFSKAEFAAAYGTASQLPASGMPEFVFAGRSNVGKSSLINKLCNRKKLAKVSSSPGKTATINFYNVGDAYLVDLPGYGYAKTSQGERRRWDSLINGYFSQKRNIVILLQLLDCRHNPSQDDMRMLNYLQHYRIPFITVLTKFDKIKTSKWNDTAESFKALVRNYGSNKMVATSAEKGLGIEELKQYIQTSFCEDNADGL